MATPELMSEAAVGSRRGVASRSMVAHHSGASRWGLPSLYNFVWSSVDILIITFCAMASARFWAVTDRSLGSLHTWHVAIQKEPTVSLTLLLWFIACYLFLSNSYGLYRSMNNRSRLNEFRLTVQACLNAGLILCGTIYLSRSEAVSRLIVITTVLACSFALGARRVVWRLAMQHRFDQGIDTRKVLIVGVDRTAQALRHHLESIRHLGYTFMGFVTAAGESAPEPLENVVVGSTDNLIELARANFAEEIFISGHYDRAELMDLVDDAARYGISVRLIPDLHDGLVWNAQMEFIGHFPTLPLHQHEFPLLSYIGKRTLDLALSIIALSVLSPVMLAISIAILIDSPGPIFYLSERIGRKGKRFRCFKFRTMVPDADAIRSRFEHMNEREGVLFKIANDPRITRVGRILRKYSLDELPQFMNVLLGDMSIVGPRPPIASEVAQYDLSHLRRLDVLPGITGLWQVEARQDPSFDSYISLDTAYVENWSLWMDIKILLRTITVVFGGTGA